MIKYAKILNKETGLVEVGTGTDNSFYKSIGFTPLDVQQSDIDGNWYLIDKCEMKSDEQKAQERQSEFNKQFFLTSLGYIRRSVNMATGETKDFICDIIPALQAGLAQGIATPIITYELPDFTKEITTEYLETLQEVKPVTAEFLQECIMQLATDFMPAGLSVGGDNNEDTTDTADIPDEVETETETPADTETAEEPEESAPGVNEEEGAVNANQ